MNKLHFSLLHCLQNELNMIQKLYGWYNIGTNHPEQLFCLYCFIFGMDQTQTFMHIYMFDSTVTQVPVLPEDLYL